MEHRTCAVCGKAFQRQRCNIVGPSRGDSAGSYCSRNCAQIGSRQGFAYPCPNCGKPVYRSLSRIRRGVGKYCSIECFLEFRQRRVRRVCPICGKRFEVQRHRPGRKRGIYCSVPCYRQARSSSLEDLVAHAMELRGYSFERQVPVGPYVVDFVIRDRKVPLVIEVDGDFWHSSKEQMGKAIRRDAYLRAAGYGIYHLTETAIKKDALAFQMELPLAKEQSDHTVD